MLFVIQFGLGVEMSACFFTVRFALDIDLDAPKVRVPLQSFTANGNESNLVLDLGHFTLKTEVHTLVLSTNWFYVLLGSHGNYDELCYLDDRRMYNCMIKDKAYTLVFIYLEGILLLSFWPVILRIRI